jgi:hypothetical protein
VISANYKITFFFKFPFAVQLQTDCHSVGTIKLTSTEWFFFKGNIFLTDPDGESLRIVRQHSGALVRALSLIAGCWLLF